MAGELISRLRAYSTSSNVCIYAEAATEIERLTKENEDAALDYLTVSKMNSEYHEKLGDVVADLMRMKLRAEQAEAAITRLTARIAVLEGALKTASDLLDHYGVPGKRDEIEGVLSNREVS